MIKQRWLAIGVLLGVATATALAGSSVAAPPGSESSRALAAITAMYAALQTDNLSEYRKIVSPDFYAFDQGRRYDGDALAEEIKSLHASGYVFRWTVTRPDVHVLGDVAWVTYVNRGSIRDKSRESRMTWQDSAVLQRVHGRWRVWFLHSSLARKSG